MKNEEEQNTVCSSEIDRPHFLIPIYNPLRPFAALLTTPRSVQISVGPLCHPWEQQLFGCGYAALCPIGEIEIRAEWHKFRP